MLFGLLPDRPRTAAESAAHLARLIRRGARGPMAAEWTAAAAHNVDGRDRLAVARELADRVRRQVAYVSDEYGRDDAQSAEATVARTAGDCEDFAVLFGALALRAGLRVGLAILHDQDGNPVHVLPTVEDPKDGRRVPVELTRPAAFGSWPHDVGSYSLWNVVPEAAGGLGFLPALIGGLVSAGAAIFGAKQQSDQTKAVAKANASIAESQARAARDAAGASFAAAKLSEQAATERTRASLETLQRVVPAAGLALVAATVLPRIIDAAAGTGKGKRR